MALAVFALLAPRNAGPCAPRPGQVSREEIEAIARAVVARLTEGR